jgi:DNA-directed RNA polymerase specialized sigma24 family protein
MTNRAMAKRLEARRPTSGLRASLPGSREKIVTVYPRSYNCAILAPNCPTARTNQGPLPLPETRVKKEITREKFEGFLAWLSPEGERAGEEYERLRFRLSTFFSQRRCRFSEELADETINRVILKLDEEQIENKLAYCYGVARNVYRESLRREREHLDIDEVQVAAHAPEDEQQSFPRECLERCLAELAPESRSLILDYFSEVRQAKIDLHRRISEKLEMTQVALRMRVMRIKQKLKICVEECMG